MFLERMTVTIDNRERELEIHISGTTQLVITPNVGMPVTLFMDGDALMIDFDTVDRSACQYVIGDLRELD